MLGSSEIDIFILIHFLTLWFVNLFSSPLSLFFLPRSPTDHNIFHITCDYTSDLSSASSRLLAFSPSSLLPFFPPALLPSYPSTPLGHRSLVSKIERRKEPFPSHTSTARISGAVDPGNERGEKRSSDINSHPNIDIGIDI